MKKVYSISIIFLLFFTSNIIRAQHTFNTYFFPKTLRIDYHRAGNYAIEGVFMDELFEEPHWAGSLVNLIDTFFYGEHRVEVRDSASNQIIYARGYSSLFFEWQNTVEAKYMFRTFSESVRIPFPKNTIKVDFLSRDSLQVYKNIQYFYISPISSDINAEKPVAYKINEMKISGDINHNIDILIIPDGYTQKEMAKFRKDAQEIVDEIFNCSPYMEYKDKFNVRAIEVPSMESGPDLPHKKIWKNTTIGMQFNTFGSERYLMTAKNKAIQAIAAQVPCEHIILLSNSAVYGGGGIYNLYATTSSRNPNRNYVITHELGHSFAGLGDEYYNSETPYNDMYNQSLEPWEPNITTLVNFDKKWKSMLEENTPVPTPDNMRYRVKVGVFEGGGYAAKGIYRPRYDCSMKSISYNNFCPVCKKAIIDMIEFSIK